MRLVKLAVLSLVVLFCVLTAMSLLIPSHVRISRAINLHASAEGIFHLIDNPDQWPQWYPAFQKQNATALLQQHQVHITTMMKTDTLRTMRWQQAGKRPVINGWHLHRFTAPDSATLQWYMDFQLSWYPWQKFSSLFYEKTYGTMMEQGLQNIKRLAEDAAPAGAFRSQSPPHTAAPDGG